METIRHAVGIRNGVMVMPNDAADLRTITGLLDRIPLSRGGTAEMPGSWLSDRTALIAEVTAAIIAFQTVNRRPVIDGVVDPGGGTLQQMNALAGPTPITATVVGSGSGPRMWPVADPTSLDGTRPLRRRDISPSITRTLIRIDGSSVKWFGVVVPQNSTGVVVGGVPHIFFTPSPWQHHPPCVDSDYDQFNSVWMDLADNYTSVIGSQLVASGARQILVIPFYKNSQASDLGDFLTNWKEVISAVVTAAISSIDPLFLRDRFEFDRIFSSSFSNGIVTHQNFNTRGTAAASMTRMGFDLDGQASGSLWRPSRAVVYLNRSAPNGINPMGANWYVGGRFAEVRTGYLPGTGDHSLCPFLLLHGLSRFGNIP